MLFNPYELKNTVLRNRIVMAPMTRSMSPGGVPTQAVIDYYERRSKAEAVSYTHLTLPTNREV